MDAMAESDRAPMEGPDGAARAGWLAARLMRSSSDSRRRPGAGPAAAPADACRAGAPCGGLAQGNQDHTSALARR